MLKVDMSTVDVFLFPPPPEIEALLCKIFNIHVLESAIVLGAHISKIRLHGMDALHMALHLRNILTKY